MRRLLTEVEKAEIIEGEWAKARAKNPKVATQHVLKWLTGWA